MTEEKGKHDADERTRRAELDVAGDSSAQEQELAEVQKWIDRAWERLARDKKWLADFMRKFHIDEEQHR